VFGCINCVLDYVRLFHPTLGSAGLGKDRFIEGIK